MGDTKVEKQKEVFKKEHLDEVLKEMMSSTAPNTFNKGGAISYLIDGIKKMQSVGHTNEAIADFLSTKGIRINTGTLKSYLAKLAVTKKESIDKKQVRSSKSKGGKSVTIKNLLDNDIVLHGTQKNNPTVPEPAQKGSQKALDRTKKNNPKTAEKSQTTKERFQQHQFNGDDL